LKFVELVLRTEHIALDSLLKSIGLAPSGGAAKALIAEGRVQVDGRDELRKTRKLRAGQVVQVGETRIRVLAPSGGAGSDPTAGP
jgi:ribosome-associated protein